MLSGPRRFAFYPKFYLRRRNRSTNLCCGHIHTPVTLTRLDGDTIQCQGWSHGYQLETSSLGDNPIMARSSVLSFNRRRWSAESNSLALDLECSGGRRPKDVRQPNVFLRSFSPGTKGKYKLKKERHGFASQLPPTIPAPPNEVIQARVSRPPAKNIWQRLLDFVKRRKRKTNLSGDGQ